MTSFKLTVSDTKGKSLTKELKDAEATPLLGLEVGAEADATIVGFEGKIKITGGSDKSGVPMRQDVHGGASASFSSFVRDFPFVSDTVSLKLVM